MSAARLAAEAAFADPGIALQRRPAAAVVIEVRAPRRFAAAPAVDEQPVDNDESQLPPGDRPSRVFRMDPALRQAMGLPSVDDSAPATVASTAAAPMPTRRRRRAAPPVHIVHAAASAAVRPDTASPASAQLPMTAHWAPIASALARLEATFAAIRAAQDFNSFAERHLPLSAKAP